MISNASVVAQCDEHARVANAILDYLAEGEKTVDVYTLIEVIGERLKVPDAEVSAAIVLASRHLDWLYGDGPVRFRIAR